MSTYQLFFAPVGVAKLGPIQGVMMAVLSHRCYRWHHRRHAGPA